MFMNIYNDEKHFLLLIMLFVASIKAQTDTRMYEIIENINSERIKKDVFMEVKLMVFPGNWLAIFIKQQKHTCPKCNLK